MPDLPRGQVRARDWDGKVITGRVEAIHRDLAEPTVAIRVSGGVTGTILRFMPLSRIIGTPSTMGRTVDH